MAYTAPADAAPVAAAYLAQQQCARQWRGFLHALSEEFVSALPAQDLQALMFRIGARFSSERPLPASKTLEELQQAMSQIWTELDWGYVLLTQHAEFLEIKHCFSPLASAFGQDQGTWSSGFLQGAYQQWFDTAGSGGLRVDMATAADGWGTAVFHLAR